MFATLLINSLRLALREKVNFPLFALVTAALTGVSFWLFTADGTLLGVLRMMTLWQFYTVGAWLMLFTVYLATTLLDAELQAQTIIVMAVKPVPRYQILAAKIAAIGLLAGVLVIIAATAGWLTLTWRTTATAQLRANHPDILRLNAAERQTDVEQQIAMAQRNFLLSRRGFLPTPMLPQTIPYNSSQRFNFTDLPLARNLLFRYRVYGTHRAADFGRLQARWEFSDATKTYTHTTDFLGGETAEFLLPVEFGGPSLSLQIYNISSPNATTPAAQLDIPRTGLQLLVPTGSFIANYARAWSLLWIRLLMLAIIGVGLTPLVGGSVNAFVMVGIIFIGLLNPLLTWSANANWWENIMQIVMQFFLNFAETNPTAALNSGVEITYSFLAKQFFTDIILRGGTVLLVGWWSFQRRELAIYRGGI